MKKLTFINCGLYKSLLFNALLMPVLLLFSGQLNAQTAWGYSCGIFSTPGISPGSIYQFDLTTGAPTLIGSVSCTSGTDLYAGEFINGTFYALENTGKTLVSIDGSANCSTLVNLTGVQSGHTLSGLSHSTATGITYVLSTNISVTSLYTLNMATGALTLVGNLSGVAGGITLMVDGQNNAFVLDIISDKIFPVNLATAVPGTGVSITQNGNPINLNFAQDADFGCNANGDIIGVLYQGGGNGQLGTINPATGVFTATAALGVEVCAFSINCPATTCPATVSIKAKGLKANPWGNNGANDPNTFYYGLTNSKRLDATITGGVGPYTYTWSNTGSNFLLPRSYYPDNTIDLFEPTAATTVTCTISDQGTGCTYYANLFIDWTDEYACPKVGNTWYIKVCQNGTTTCVPWTTGKNLLLNGLATLGDCVTKTQQVSANNSFSLYPNPTSGMLTIEVLASLNAQSELYVLDVNGRIIQSEQIEMLAGYFYHEVDLTALPSGVYMVSLKTEENVYTERIQIVR